MTDQQSPTPQLSSLAQSILQDDILTAMGLDTVDDAQKTELYRTMVATVQDRVLARVLDELTDEARERLLHLLDAGQAAEAEAFIGEQLPGVDAMIMQEAILYKAEMVESARKISDALGIHDEQPITSGAPAVAAAYPLPPTPPAVISPDQPAA